MVKTRWLLYSSLRHHERKNSKCLLLHVKFWLKNNMHIEKSKSTNVQHDEFFTSWTYSYNQHPDPNKVSPPPKGNHYSNFYHHTAFASFWTLHKWNQIVDIPLHLTIFGKHYVYELHLCCYIQMYFVNFLCYVLFCVNIL